MPLPTYRLRVAWRESRGNVRPPARDETITASSLREAIGAALGDGDSILAEGTNLAWLTDAEGNLVWTLRMDDSEVETA